MRKLLYNRSMETRTKKGIGYYLRLCPLRLGLAGLGALLILAYGFLRKNPALSRAVCEGVARPWHRTAARLCAWYPWSVAEMVYFLGGTALLIYVVWALVRMKKQGRWKEGLCRLGMMLLAVGLLFYGLACFLWGLYYSTADTPEALGLQPEPVRAEALYQTADYFLKIANTYARQTDRDENKAFVAERDDLFAASPHLYDNLAVVYPALDGPALRAKPMLFSKFMSWINFTGFFFPFTGEASLNVDAPICLLPSTIAHELAHQRGVAREDEANFVAVLACMESGNADFCYSGSLMALIHLGNALYKADPARYEELRQGYSEEVLADLRQNNLYWQQYETKAAEVSEAVYEGVLASYGEERGMQSYGACVDLLVAYYKNVII